MNQYPVVYVVQRPHAAPQKKKTWCIVAVLLTFVVLTSFGVIYMMRTQANDDGHEPQATEDELEPQDNDDPATDEYQRDGLFERYHRMSTLSPSLGTELDDFAPASEPWYARRGQEEEETKEGFGHEEATELGNPESEHSGSAHVESERSDFEVAESEHSGAGVEESKATSSGCAESDFESKTGEYDAPDPADEEYQQLEPNPLESVINRSVNLLPGFRGDEDYEIIN